MKIKPDYYSLAKPYYRFDFNLLENDITKSKFNTHKLLIDIKADGLRMTIGKDSDGVPFAYVDPAELKRKSPNVSNRLPAIMDELKTYPDGTVFDAELISVNEDWTEVLHRTTTNSLLNATNYPPDKLSQISLAYVFRILFLDGDDIRSYPLKEEIELRNKLKSQKHIHIETVTTDLDKASDGYVVNGSNMSQINKAVDNILNNRNSMNLKKMSEGVMIKLLDHRYEYPYNKGWAKVKKYYEVDVRVLGKDKVKGTKDVWNYHIGIDINKDYYDHIPDKNKLAIDGKYYMVLGKTDNCKLQFDTSDIIRIAAEEVIKYDNGKYPYYTTYIARVMEQVPEKKVTDSLLVLERLSMLEPMRVPILEVQRWEVKNKAILSDIIPSYEDIQCYTCPLCKSKVICGITEDKAKSVICPYCGHLGVEITKSIKKDVEASKKEGKIPYDIYNKYVKQNEPLPKEFYKDQREGEAFVQCHFRGLLPEDVEKYNNNEITFAELIEGHSIHNDLRMDIGAEILIQWVITQDKVESYIDTWLGNKNEKSGNVEKALAIVKPSALLPKYGGEAKKSDDEEGLILDKKGAELISKYVLHNDSYFIKPGEVGTTKDKYAYLALIWKGKVKTGTERPDIHEYFYYPDDSMPNINKELINGKYIIRAFKLKGGNKWWLFKASGDEE